ncbi:hypothetical protein CNR27_05885 [Luteimonas chenhongjianii]|uniref:Uncharacterized protein n=1 Tax=Luteimonas chenhongjianii TaxID=2006110 RepID=A0A290XD06_9GAMM|nr:hypothetical protein CNR27_05885 [Luteimonas chenhongjianii]
MDAAARARFKVGACKLRPLQTPVRGDTRCGCGHPPIAAVSQRRVAMGCELTNRAATRAWPRATVS